MPRKLSAESKRRRLCVEAYQSLLKTLKDGVPVRDPRTGQQVRDEDGSLVFNPAPASAIGQARALAKELEREISAEASSPYDMSRAPDPLSVIMALGYSEAEAQDIILAKKDQSAYDQG